MSSDHCESNQIEILNQLSKKCGFSIESYNFATYLDEIDPLKDFGKKFHYPLNKELPKTDHTLAIPEEKCVYLCGNSLGLQPKRTGVLINNQLHKWATMGVHGHLEGELPWIYCDDYLKKDTADLIGAKENEVGNMNALTVNLHMLLIAFYKPTENRNKILCEANAFPSDNYAFKSQIQLNKLNPNDCLIEIEPREGEKILRTEDILKLITEQGESIAVICLSGVQYLTGQLFDMATITAAGQQTGCIVGWDLAHAVGNVELSLHDWGVDFACWCSYKYLNSGAGGIGGLFVHEKHNTATLSKLHGWWSHKENSRFQMTNMLEESSGADAFRISNPSMFLTASLRASLDVFKEAGGMTPLRKKSLLLTSYLEYLLETYFGAVMKDGKPVMEIVTPKNVHERGAQLSVIFTISVKIVSTFLEENGVVFDMRKNGTLRIAPAPLYNSFEDVFRFVHLLHVALQKANR